jgi:hypothetical protein
LLSGRRAIAYSIRTPQGSRKRDFERRPAVPRDRSVRLDPRLRRALSALRISEPALLIAGALILFLIAVPMIFPSVKLGLDSETQAEPLIVPLAGDARTARQGRASSSIDFNFPRSNVSSASKRP